MRATFRERLETLMADTGYNTVRKFGDTTGIPYTTIYNYLRDDIDARAFNLVIISERFNVSTDWLLGLTDIRERI